MKNPKQFFDVSNTTNVQGLRSKKLQMDMAQPSFGKKLK